MTSNAKHTPTGYGRQIYAGRGEMQGASFRVEALHDEWLDWAQVAIDKHSTLLAERDALLVALKVAEERFAAIQHGSDQLFVMASAAEGRLEISAILRKVEGGQK